MSDPGAVTSAWDLDSRWRQAVAALAVDPDQGAADPAAPIRDDSELTGEAVRELHDAQLMSRQLDLAAHWLRSWNEGYHAVSSAGHEAAAAVAWASRSTDPALLHARSGGFYCARAAQVPAADPAADPALDVLGALVAAAAEPFAGGRCPPYGSRALTVIPASGSGASHLPRAVGLAFAIERAKRLRAASALDLPPDSVVVCSFDSAELNHAAATAALNAAGWCGHTGLPLPLLFVCHDEGAVAGWAAAALGSRPGLRHFSADGCDLLDTCRAARDAVDWVRRRRRPAALRLELARLMDRTVGPDIDKDPLLASARLLVESGLAAPGELLARYDEIGWQVRAAAERMAAAPKLASAREVTAPLAPRRPLRVAQAAAAVAEPDARARVFAGALPEAAGPLSLAESVNAALRDALAAYPQTVLFGPDVAGGGGSGVTAGLREAFGAARVFDTFPDETSTLGLALGCGLAGLLPVVELGDLERLWHALGQLVAEAAPTRFRSQGAYGSPLVLRVSGYADPAGLGGYAHRDNGIGALRDVPGLVIASPARPDDAADMLRTCVAAAVTDGSCCVFLEPAALRHVRDLHSDGDGGWLTPYAAPDQWSAGHAPIGRARMHGDGGDLTMISFGNGLRMCLRVAARLAEEGIGARVLDLRWLGPLPHDDVLREANATGRALLVDETRRAGGVADPLLAGLAAGGFAGPVGQVASEDSFVPLGPSASHIVIGEPLIEQAARGLLDQPARSVPAG
ncbi:MAG: hypothetical protein GEU94_14560 [Micromonosporaceae bacterium]|nr:hypothetical protein [Micromonosporaceae bacterium]